jgi:enamine deaminase RidA (YjgF/YER057c/UK114 family)
MGAGSDAGPHFYWGKRAPQHRQQHPISRPLVDWARPVIDPDSGWPSDMLRLVQAGRGASRMRTIFMLGGIAAATLAAAAPSAETPRRIGPDSSPISTSVSVPPGGRLVYISGTVPDPVDPNAAEGARFGDTEAQTRSVLRKVEAALIAQGLGFGDVVMMRVFLVAPPGQPHMDFAGMMRGYREFFGTAAQPNKPARSTMQVAGLVDPGWLVEIEVTAAK